MEEQANSQPVPTPAPEPMPVPLPDRPAPATENAPLPPSTDGSLNGPMPDELRHWNWGAFFWSWIWGVSHNVWISLLAFVPFVNFVMIFILGAKGNEWAWEHRKFQSVEQFKKVQHTWMVWGIAWFVFWILFTVGIAVSMLLALSLTTVNHPNATSSLHDTIRKNDIRTLVTAAEQYQADNNDACPPNIGDLAPYLTAGDKTTDPVTGHLYDYQHAGSNCVFSATLDNSDDPALQSDDDPTDSPVFELGTDPSGPMPMMDNGNGV